MRLGQLADHCQQADRRAKTMCKRTIYRVVKIYTFAPILSFCIVAIVTFAFRCDVGDVPGRPPCIILGINIDPLLYVMALFGSTMVLTVSTGLLMLLLLNFLYRKHK
jgi:hypothetical protein